MEIALAGDMSVYLMYWDNLGNNNKSVNGPASVYWPEINQFMAAAQSTVSTVGDVVVTKIIRGGIPKALASDPLTKILPLAAQRASTKQYSKRRSEGEVFMNPYSVGEITVNRSVGVKNLPQNPSTGNIASEAGWFTDWGKFTAFMNRYGLYPPSPPAAREGSPLQGAMILLNWRWYPIDDSMVYLSPDYEPPTTMPSLIVDEGVVTSVVADASNGEFDLSTELMELPETMGFLGETTKQIFCLTADLEEEARAARKRMPGAKFVEWFSNHWLKGRYALLPLFYSVQDIQKVLASMDKEYGRYQSQANVSCLLGEVSVPGCIVKIDHNATARCVMKTRYTVTSLIEKLSRLINVNLFTSAWEVTTLSFVADWAFNIGDFIQAATGSTGVSEFCTSYAVKDTSTLTITYNDDTMPVSTTVNLKLYRRDIINPYDHIGLKFVLGRSMNWKRCVDAFALASRPGIRRFEAVLRKQGAI